MRFTLTFNLHQTSIESSAYCARPSVLRITWFLPCTVCLFFCFFCNIAVPHDVYLQYFSPELHRSLFCSIPQFRTFYFNIRTSRHREVGHKVATPPSSPLKKKLFYVGCGLWVVGCGLWVVGVILVSRKCNISNHVACIPAMKHKKQSIVFDCDVSISVLTMGRLWSSHHGHENWIFMDIWTR